MLAHRHGQLWSGSELGRAFGVSHTTVRRYLDHLVDALLVRVLPPWHPVSTSTPPNLARVASAAPGDFAPTHEDPP